MISADNINFLKKKFHSVWNQIQELKERSQEGVVTVLPSRDGVPTLTVEHQGKSLFLHSKYNPLEEAEQFVQQFTDVDQYKHVFFYGIGLGYHVEAFLKKNPGIPFTLYEPTPEIFIHFLNRVSLPQLPAECKNLFLEVSTTHSELFLKKFVEEINEEVLLVQLPSYERLFKEKAEQFSKSFKSILENKKMSLNVNVSYEKRWIYNSLINLEDTIKTPNILLEKQDIFKDKPIILVAAGPSLQDEIEHLKYIKNHGLAYIFSLGTAVNALIANGIHPDAACTYDPTQLNQKVFQKINDESIIDIPLIYGSSVGFEVLKHYVGPKIHMITTQDTISSYYLVPKDKRPLEKIQDAGTISVIALQLLYKLKAKLVILVGQNLAFRNNLVYSAGARVTKPTEEVMESDRKHLVVVESVDGDQIQSNREYMLMKTQIEDCLKFRTDMEVINTTQGGAKIAHTSFKSLEEVMNTRLTERVVNAEWSRPEGYCYDIKHAQKQAFEMKNEYEQILKYYKQITSVFNEINRCKEHKDKNRLGKTFLKFDKLIIKILHNPFFVTFIKPMNRVQEELLLKNIEKIKYQNDFIAKAEMILQNFGKFLYGCQVDTAAIAPMFEAIQNYIFKLNPSE